MSYIVLDWETHDPNIKKGRSWPCNECTPLGAAIITSDNKYKGYYIDIEQVKKIVSEYSTIICHNAQYDCGILVMLGYDIYKHKIIDTMILARLYKSNEINCSLDVLGKKYLKIGKDEEGLIKLAQELKTRKIEPFKSDRRSPIKVVKENMHIAQKYGLEIIEQYALKDTEVTEKLYHFYKERLQGKLNKHCNTSFYSDLIKCLIKSKSYGVPVDESAIDRADLYLRKKIIQHRRNAHKIAGRGFNLNASKSFYDTLLRLGLRLEQSPATGKYTADNKFLTAQDHPICKEIILCKKYQKARNDFVIKFREFIKNGKIYPSFKPLGADTGRFTSQNPNFQNIPSRDPEMLKVCRGLFVAPEGYEWVSIDYSSQENRLAAHFAYTLGIDGGNEIVYRWSEDPHLDIHQFTADLCKITRKQAKGISHGVSYGMGNQKLADSLGVSEDKAIHLKEKFAANLPYLKYLLNHFKYEVKSNGYINTISGRKVIVDKNLPYKGLNYLIQGSASDQIMKAMVMCYRSGIDILFSVHDEINFLVKKGDQETIRKVVKIMEECYKFSLPIVAEPNTGKTWADCK